MATIRKRIIYGISLGDKVLKKTASKKTATQVCNANPGAILTENPTRWQAIVRQKAHKPLIKTFTKKAHAQKWADSQEGRMAEGTYVQKVYCAMTIQEIMAQYEKEITEKKDSARQESGALKNIYRLLGDRLVPFGNEQDRDIELSVYDINNYVRTRLQEGVMSDTVRKELNPVSNCFNVAHSLWEVPPILNVVQMAKAGLRQARVLTPGEERDRRFTQKEYNQFLNYKGRSALVPKALIVACNTALRRSELCQITPFEVIYKAVDSDKTGNNTVSFKNRSLFKVQKYIKTHDGLELAVTMNREVQYYFPQDRILHIPKEIAKTGKERDVYLADEAIAALDSLPRQLHDPRFFPIRPDALSQWISKQCKPSKFDIDDLRWHDCRHEATSRFFEMGWSIERVAASTGHEDWASLKRYTHRNRKLVHRDSVTGLVISQADEAKSRR